VNLAIVHGDQVCTIKHERLCEQMKLHFVSIFDYVSVYGRHDASFSVLSNSNLWLHAELESLENLFHRHGILHRAPQQIDAHRNYR
jgi:hypothetical protein